VSSDRTFAELKTSSSDSAHDVCTDFIAAKFEAGERRISAETWSLR
jgi:hypothetical protein